MESSRIFYCSQDLLCYVRLVGQSDVIHVNMISTLKSVFNRATVIALKNKLSFYGKQTLFQILAKSNPHIEALLLVKRLHYCHLLFQVGLT